MHLFPEESRETVQTLLRRGPGSEKFATKKKRELQRLGLQRAEAIVALWHDRSTCFLVIFISELTSQHSQDGGL